MSIDAAFAPFSFPAVGQRTDEGASVRGHAAGYAAGRKQAEEELTALRASVLAEAQEQVKALTAELETALAAIARGAEEFRARDSVQLEAAETAIASAAIELAEAIIGRELASTQDSAVAAVSRAVHEAGSLGTTVRLSPADAAVLTAHADLAPGISFVADPSLARGDAMVDIDNGSIDARIASSLARAKAALIEGAS